MTEQPDRDPRQHLLDAIDQTYAYGVLGYDSPELLVAAFEDTVRSTLLAAVDIGEAEAWCKTCRRVWESRAHQCETDAEQRLARARELHQQTCPLARGQVGTGFSCSLCDALDGQRPALDGGPTVAEAARDDQQCATMKSTAQPEE